MKNLLKRCLLATPLLLAACSSGLQLEPPSLELSAQSTTTLRLPILTTSDDAEEVLGGSVSTTGGLLDLRAKRGVLQSVGLRFQKVTIPQGATITGAHLEVKGGGAYTGPVSLSLRGEASDHAATFATSRYNLSSRSKTKVAVNWRPNNWVQGGSYRTGNLAPVVQEIVNRSGWKSGNALALLIDGLGSSGERAAIAYGGRPEHVPVLVVSYEAAATQPAPAPTPEPTPSTPVSSGTLTLKSASGADDAEQTVAGSLRGGTSVQTLDFSLEAGVAQHVGLRFANLNIPQGSTITAATLSLTASAADAGALSLQVRGEAADHAASFGLFAGRPQTAAAATWTPRDWSAGMAVRTPDLKAIVQEIVARPGWKSGNALALTISGDGKAARRAHARDAGEATAPVLSVTFEPPQAPAPEPTPTPTPAPAPAPTPETGSVLAVDNLSGEAGSERFYEVSVPAGAEALSVTMGGGTGNADLYLRYSLRPTTGSYLCGSRKSANEESCFVATPRTGVYHLMVYGKSAYAGAALRVNYKVAAAPAPEPAPAPTPAPDPAPEPAPTPTPETGADLATWHSRLLATIETPRYHPDLDPKLLAASGDLFRLGRELNMHVTSMILAYRETGDRDIVRHLDQIMNIAKGKLDDPDGDGFRNWLYLHTTGDHTTKPYIGTDLIALDEMLTHSMVAAVAYTFKQAGFDASAAFWTDYLKNDFEAKWRKRSGRSSSYPFVNHFLMHPTTQFVRYHLYMHELTGESSYYTEAKRLTAAIKGTMRLGTSGGYIWDHQVSRQTGCQPMTYVKHTTQALVDLATADPALFDASFMERVAYTMAHTVLLNLDGTSLAGNICGEGTFGTASMFAAHPFAQLAPWDSSGRLRTAAERVYAAFERNSPSPKTANLAATMVFTLSRR